VRVYYEKKNGFCIILKTGKDGFQSISRSIYILRWKDYTMLKITVINLLLLLLFLQCADKPVPVAIENKVDPQELDDYNAYVRKSALTINLYRNEIIIENKVYNGSDSVTALWVHWSEKDSNLFKDSIWVACHELPRMVCSATFRYFTKDTSHYFKYPEYLCVGKIWD
jgi:hypothetical protein